MAVIRSIARRELRSYFATPLAYVFIVIFLALAGLFTFYLGGFYERGQADLVIGSRVLGQAAPGSLRPQQRLGNWLACTLIALRFGRGFTDLGPFRTIRYEALTKLRLGDRTFGWNVEMQIKALKAGLRIVEVPVRYRPRIGRSKISGTVMGTLRAGARILWTIARSW